MTRFRLRSCMAAAVLLLPGAGRAEEKSAADTAVVRVEEVVVTALRGRDRLREIPAASFVFSREEIRRKGVSRLSSLLQSLPGLYGYLQNSTGDVSVVDPRGFTAQGERSYLKLLVNGQDVRDVENGGVDWDWVFPDEVEQLEIVEGPGAWVYGDGAEGGIINIVRPAPSGGLHSDCGLRFGSFGLWTGGLALTGQGERTAGSLRSGLRRADGWRDRSRERVYSCGGEGRWSLSDRTRLSLDAAWLDADRQDPGTLTPDQLAADREQADTQTDFTHSRRLLIGAHLTTGAATGSEWRLSPYFRHENGDQVRTLFSQTFLSQAKSHPTRSWTAGGEAGWRRSLEIGGRAISVSAGSQAEQSKLRSDYHDYDASGEGPLRERTESWRTTVSGFVDTRIALDSRTSARLGFRQDAIRLRSENRIDGSEIPVRTLWSGSPFVALSRGIGDRCNLYASYSSAFRAPSLNQLFDRRPIDASFSPVPFYLSNPGLKPQYAHSVEIGGRVTGTHRGYAMLTLYSIRVHNEIDFDATTFSYANIDRSWHRGVQLALEQPLVADLTAQVNGTYSPTTIRGGPSDGNQINAVPLGTAYGGLQWQSADSWSLEGGIHYVGRQYLDKANQHRMSDFATVDLGASARLPFVRAALRVGNVLDRNYEDTGFLLDLSALGIVQERFSPAAGRSFTVSLTAD